MFSLFLLLYNACILPLKSTVDHAIYMHHADPLVFLYGIFNALPGKTFTMLSVVQTSEKGEERKEDIASGRTRDGNW